MLFNRLLKRYKQLPIIAKLIIPQIVIFAIGIMYISYAYNHTSKIADNYNIIKNSIIPSLEKSNTNIMLLKQISNDFTFAILASENDFLNSPKQHNQKIIQNLRIIHDSPPALREGIKGRTLKIAFLFSFKAIFSNTFS